MNERMSKKAKEKTKYITLVDASHSSSQTKWHSYIQLDIYNSVK